MLSAAQTAYVGQESDEKQGFRSELAIQLARLLRHRAVFSILHQFGIDTRKWRRSEWFYALCHEG